jgi:hypothetical protein
VRLNSLTDPFCDGKISETVLRGILTQHTGSGKKNRNIWLGFNPNHGTDTNVSKDLSSRRIVEVGWVDRSVLEI